jgi:hypothetical protein
MFFALHRYLLERFVGRTRIGFYEELDRFHQLDNENRSGQTAMSLPGFDPEEKNRLTRLW